MNDVAFKKYGFAYVTTRFLLLSVIGHWLFGWFTHVDDEALHQAPGEIGDYFVEMLRDTFENWQSEFLQLLWEVVGLTLLLHVGSPNPTTARTAPKPNSTPSCVTWILPAPNRRL